MTEKPARKSSLELVAAIGTIVLLLLAIVLLALDILARANGRHIEDVPDPPMAPVLVCGMALLLAAAWAVWLARTRGLKNTTTRIVAGIAAVLLVVTPLVAWQELSSHRELTVVSATCEADASRNAGFSDCSEEAVDTIVLLQAVDGSNTWVPDSITNNLSREFTDLPDGPWEARLTVDGPVDTVTVNVIAERDGDPVRLTSLRPSFDEESDRLRWSGVVPFGSDISNVQVQFVRSPNPAVESARLRFEVRSCEGQNIRTFDASQCQPMDTDSPFIREETPKDTRTWRQLWVTREGGSFVVANLEARTYTLQPDYVFIEQETQSTDVLIIPAPMEQTAANSIAEPGASSFTIDIDANTGELAYIIYVFPAGPTFAQGD